MPSQVDICNTALSHIGDTANVTDISPPDGSAQAGYCAVFYPIALNALLEMATWGFSTKRIALAEVANPTITTYVDSSGATVTTAGMWQFAYAAPNEMLTSISVLPPDALSDYSQRWRGPWAGFCGYPYPDWINRADSFYIPHDYTIEIDAKGNQIILTNQCNAVLRYTMLVTDPMKYSGLFILALSYMLASLLAGPLIKGAPGAAMSANMLKLAQGWAAQAEVSDANQRRITLEQSVPWMAGR